MMTGQITQFSSNSKFTKDRITEKESRHTTAKSKKKSSKVIEKEVIEEDSSASFLNKSRSIF
jgi:hypothetical protein